MRRIVIYAPRIRVGGGLKLLKNLLADSPPSILVDALVDERTINQFPKKQNVNLVTLSGSLFGSLSAEKKLKRAAEDADLVLCLSNLGPLFKLHARSVLFLQNRYLVDKNSDQYFPSGLLRLWVLRFLLKYSIKNCDSIVVQSSSMKRLLGTKTPVNVWPFAEELKGGTQGIKTRDFLYIASGEPHKNHKRLLDAWKVLAEENIFPILTLTVDAAQFPQLASQIDSAKKSYNLKIENLGNLASDSLWSIYQSSRCVIFPSVLESFGLPLIEAKQHGMDIVASELDFVRDVADPAETFDPLSAVSIARAVKRYLKLIKSKEKVLTPLEFWNRLLGQVLSSDGSAKADTH
jgi:glycosyltransferase involved in cell wall biosynthesis